MRRRKDEKKGGNDCCVLLWWKHLRTTEYRTNQNFSSNSVTWYFCDIFMIFFDIIKRRQKRYSFTKSNNGIAKSNNFRSQKDLEITSYVVACALLRIHIIFFLDLYLDKNWTKMTIVTILNSYCCWYWWWFFYCFPIFKKINKETENTLRKFLLPVVESYALAWSVGVEKLHTTYLYNMWKETFYYLPHSKLILKFFRVHAWIESIRNPLDTSGTKMKRKITENMMIQYNVTMWAVSSEKWVIEMANAFWLLIC